MTESETHTGDRPANKREASAAHDPTADDPDGTPTADPQPSTQPDSQPASHPDRLALPVGSQKLDPNWMTVDRISHWIIAGTISVIAIVYLALQWTMMGMALPWALTITGLMFVLIAWLVFRAHVYPRLWYRQASYELSETAIEIRTGVLFKNIMTVPRSRVQHTDVAQGPLMRRYGIATLVIHTAGTQHAKVELPGLAKERAERIRDHLIARVAQRKPMMVAPKENASVPMVQERQAAAQEADGAT